jgi:hypothetical protein
MDVVVTRSGGSTTVRNTARDTVTSSVKSVGAHVDFRWSSEGGLKFNIMARKKSI